MQTQSEKPLAESSRNRENKVDMRGRRIKNNLKNKLKKLQIIFAFEKHFTTFALPYGKRKGKRGKTDGQNLKKIENRA